MSLIRVPTMNRTTLLAGTVGVVAVLLSPPVRAAEPGIEFFEKKIRPVLVEHCYRCHSAEAQKNRKLKGGLLLDSREGLRKGGDSGPALVPGQPANSLLVKALRQTDDLRMPPRGKLPAHVLADFEKWIALGAPDPRDGSRKTTKTIDWDQARRTWAFQLPVKHSVPRVQDAKWPRKELDHFLLAEMEKRGLKPVRPATKLELIRRATFDLIGLPPTPEEIDAFLKDKSPDAYAKVVDRLLQSPHYGERWGRYWLDVARYADDKALARSAARPHSYRYRDWVIQAFNRDMPYDQFVRLQVAGDLLREPADPLVRLAGLGFQGLGAEYHRGNFAAQVMADELDDRIDTLSRGLLGLTVACARCHDHKYDPIPTRDYYSLAAAYQGSTLTEIPAATPEAAARYQAWKTETRQKEGHLTQWLQERGRGLGRSALPEIGAYLRLAWRIHALRAHKVRHDEAALARKEKLHPYFLTRLLRYLDRADVKKKAAFLKPWLAMTDKVNASLAIPADLRKWSESFQSEVNAALHEYELPKSRVKRKQILTEPQRAILQALWLDGNAPFAVPPKEMTGLLDGPQRKHYETQKAELDRLKRNGPPAPVMIHGIRGGGQAMRVNIRGNVERLGEPAPPGFLRILALSEARSGKPRQFTRLELADAIATAKNPLTARVYVNRVWQHHFGRGIVGTASNFGKLGDRPTHPELLDTLAVRFIESGWSTHWLHREIMLSAAYQLSTANNPNNAARDEDNRYLWRMTPRRLDLEAWRDALLAVSGRLDATVGGPSRDMKDAKNVRRTIYAKVSRAVPNAMAALFDFPDANATSARRNVTTVPQQQLFVLNSPFLLDSARAFAARLDKAERDPAKRIALAYRLAFGRLPTDAERREALEFLRASSSSRDRLTNWEQFAQALLAANEFNWVD